MTNSLSLRRKFSFRLRRRTTIGFYSDPSKASVPGCGGIEVDEGALAQYPLLPPCVAMHEPTQSEIMPKEKNRFIFLNTPLLPWEQDVVSRFRALILEQLELPPDGDLPRWLLPILTRLLQQCKYRPDEALHLVAFVYENKVRKLPILASTVKPLLEHGFVYWHGRDKKHRPMLMVNLGRAEYFFSNAEATKDLFLFTMEFGVRHLLVPGRVESWCVVIDMAGLSDLGRLFKRKDFAMIIATFLGKLYSGRMAWTKIFNFPGGIAARALRSFIEGIVNALGKADRVSFVRDAARELDDVVSLGELEQRFGGTAPDVTPAVSFPYRMFSGPPSETSYGASQDLYAATDLEFHEGFIWAECLKRQTNWHMKAGQLPLPPAAAEALQLPPCTDLAGWRGTMLRWRASQSTDDVILQQSSSQVEAQEMGVGVLKDERAEPPSLPTTQERVEEPSTAATLTAASTAVTLDSKPPAALQELLVDGEIGPVGRGRPPIADRQGGENTAIKGGGLLCWYCANEQP